MLSGKPAGVTNPVTSAAVLTNNALTLGNGSRGLSSLANAAAGQVLASGTPPAYTATPSVTSITFGAGTALSNYSEGTWTPVDGSGAGIAVGVDAGTYTRIGRLVEYEFAVNYPSTASGVQAKLGGLPFTGGGFQSPTSSVVTDAALGQVISGAVNASTTTVNFFEAVNAAVNVKNSDLSSHLLRMTGLYHV